MIKNVKDQAVNSEEKEFTAFLVNILQSSNIENFERKMSQISKDELKELYRQFKNEKKISKAMDGAKLNLLNKVNKVCPEGTEMFLSGGCIKCRKKKDNDFKFKDSVKRFAKDEEVVEKHQDGGKSEIPSIPYNRNRFS